MLKRNKQSGRFTRIQEPKNKQMRITEKEKEHILERRKEIRYEKIVKTKKILSENWDKFSTWDSDSENLNLQFSLEDLEEELSINFLEEELKQIGAYLEQFIFYDSRVNMEGLEEFIISVNRGYATIDFTCEED